MGWRNPPVSWSELHRRLSDGRSTGRPVRSSGGDSPAWSRRRQPYEPPPLARRAGGVAYAELHCHSNFSFLDGASHPEELAEQAARLGLEALALTDHDGFYGVVRFAEAASAVGLPTVFGVELTLRSSPGRSSLGHRQAVADPPGPHLVVLARDAEGYGRLCRAVSEAHLAGGGKGRPVVDVTRLAGAHRGHWLVLTGCRKGEVPAALEGEGPAAASRALGRLVDAFGRQNVAVECWDHGDPLDAARNDALAKLAVDHGVELVATNNVHYATPSRRRLSTALAAVRARRSLDEIDGWLPASSGAHLRSGEEQIRRFSRWPGVVETAAELGRQCAFDLKLVAPRLPDFPVPPGHSEMTWLAELVERGATARYGPRPSERVEGAWRQIDHELAVVKELGFAGYFLVVWDIVEFCRKSGILCQGRGSAANSAVCYAIGITNADAVSLGLLFERFLSPERDGPPDIDLDIEADRREEVIQYVYRRYGRHNAAQVANVITYRARSAIRDMGRALGHSPGQLDAWARQVDHWGPLRDTLEMTGPGGSPDHDVPQAVLDLALQVESFPRHLGIHSGGMVICDRPVVEVCPVEWARMEDRSVLQWDKDDCAAVGLVKFDLLGLGMLSALHGAIDLVQRHQGVGVDLGMLPQEDEVYAMLRRADSVGVFQVESRAQMATLPRLKPRCFYDLVVEVALIRPGPIQGGSVHPYIRRRNGQEPVSYLHPLLEPALSKTLGVPLFQEQLMQVAIDVAGFSAAEADQLRQAMGSKRSSERMERLRARLYEGMADKGISGELADSIYGKLAAFANFGFPESHSVSFAYLVYASAWFKLHYPAAFCAALLNAQPMGFWAPRTLVEDARRHGVEVRRADVNRSSSKASLEAGEGGPALRLGLEYVRGVGTGDAEAIAAAGPYCSMEDLARRSGLSRAQLEALATAGALGGLPAVGSDPGQVAAGQEPTGAESGLAGAPPGGRAAGRLTRRESLWAAGAVAQSGPDRLRGIVSGTSIPPLPGMDAVEETVADLWATGIALGGHPVGLVRPRLEALGAVTAASLSVAEPGARLLVGGLVTHRQRPATAQGTTFMNLEDETGLVNVVCSRGAWVRYRKAASGASALLVRGRIERSEGVVNLVAERMDALDLGMSVRSRDFR